MQLLYVMYFVVDQQKMVKLTLPHVIILCSFEVSSDDRHLWDLEYHVSLFKPRILFSKCFYDEILISSWQRGVWCCPCPSTRRPLEAKWKNCRIYPNFPSFSPGDPLLCINKRKCLQWGLLHHLVDICFEHFSSTTLWLFNGTTCSSPPSRSGGRTISYCGRPRKQFAFPPITPRHIGAILRNFSTLACQNPFSSTFKLKVKLERKSADSLFCPSLPLSGVLGEY